MEERSSNLVELTTDIVTAYVQKNQIGAADVGSLIASVHSALLNAGSEPEPEEVVAKPSAAQVRKSVSANGIVSFIDGKTYKTLRRHLSNKGFTQDTYIATFGLPSDYPMVAPAYAARRSELAKAAGLGQGGRKAKGPAPKAKPSRRQPQA